MREYIGRNGGAFWRVFEPKEVDGQWLLRVEFGKLGTNGQARITPFWSREAAVMEMGRRISEKTLRKDYKLKSVPKQTFKVVACSHNSIQRFGNKWKCLSCKTTVDFMSPQPNTPPVDVEKKVRRFIDLSWKS